MGAWRPTRASASDLTKDEARLALGRIDPLCEELFLAEQARVDVRLDGVASFEPTVRAEQAAVNRPGFVGGLNS